MPKIDHSARGEILRASRSREGGVPLAEEHKTKAKLAIRTAAATRYELDPKALSGWEAPPHASLYEPSVIGWVPDFVGGPYYIFFDDPADCIFEVEKPWQLVVIFERTRRKGPYYITNEAADYLFIYDQNHFIHGQGKAVDWLRDGLNRVYMLLNAEQKPLAAGAFEVEGFGRTLKIRCALLTEPVRLFKLVLDGCDTVEWQALTHRPPKTAPLAHLFIGERINGRQRVSLSSSGLFRLNTHCESVRIEAIQGTQSPSASA